MIAACGEFPASAASPRHHAGSHLLSAVGLADAALSASHSVLSSRSGESDGEADVLSEMVRTPHPAAAFSASNKGHFKIGIAIKLRKKFAPKCPHKDFTYFFFSPIFKK